MLKRASDQPHRAAAARPAIFGLVVLVCAGLLVGCGTGTTGGQSGAASHRGATAPGSAPTPVSTIATPTSSTGSTGSAGTAATTAASQAKLRPAIWWHPIPFGAKRRAETAAYANRHYGLDTWHLNHPRVIVEHYTESTSWQSAWNLFSQDVPDSELHELPGTCAHFLVSADGRIIQIVKTTIICRHTVGLNWTAIGIENVGMSDADILHNARELRASLRLTAYLMATYHIAIGNVIGHNESLNSRYHHELDPAWRCQTHQDWQHPDMQIYRRDLARVLHQDHVPLGRGYHARPTDC